MNNLGERLLEYRKAKGLSQEVVAEKIGVSRQTISKWETNQSLPDFDKILPICELFEISTDELMTGKKEEHKQGEVDQKQKEEVLNRKRALVISLSVFLYIIGAFAFPYMLEVLKYQDAHAIMVTGVLWGIATLLLVYFFIAHPSKEKKIEDKEEIDILDAELEKVNKQVENIEKQSEKMKFVGVIGKEKKKESRVLEIIALFFTIIYLTISFITMAWHITWILWLVFALVEEIVKLIFDIRSEKNEE